MTPADRNSLASVSSTERPRISPWPGSSLPGNWISASLACLPVNLLPTLLILLTGTVRGLGRRDWRGEDRLTRWVGLLGLGMLGLTLWAADPQRSLLGLANHLPFLVFFLIATPPLQQPRLRQQVAQVILLGSVFVSILGLGQMIWGWQGRWHIGPWMILKLIDWARPTSVFTSHNILAVYLVMALILGAGLFLSNKSRWIVIGAYLLGVPLLVFTASRNGWGIACVGLVLGLIVYRVWIGLGLVAGFCGLCMGAAIGIPGLRAIIPSLIWERLAATFDPSSSFFSSTLNRIDAWQFALQMIRDRPWQGWGWQSFPMLYNAQIPPPDERLHHCHNLYLTLGAEGGLLVLIGFLLIWSVILIRGWRLGLDRTSTASPSVTDRQAKTQPKDPLILAYTIALTCYFLSGVLDAVFFDGRINVLVWVLLAAVNGAWWQEQGETDRSRSVTVPQTPRS